MAARCTICLLPTSRTSSTPPSSNLFSCSHRLPSRRKHACVSFYGTKCQEKYFLSTHVALQRRRPLPVGTCGVACPRSDREGVPDLDLGSRVPRWHRNRLPVRVTDDPRPSFRRWHPRRDRSKSVLASNAGTILLSGPRTANASFGTPRGHSLIVGPPESCSGARSAIDTLPRTKLVSRYCANRHLLLGDRRLHT
jgi:hypothetical protein